MEERRLILPNFVPSHTCSNRDRLSSLPEVLLHEICSSLDMKTLVETTLVSKLWRYLWLSVPNLNFNTSKLYDDQISFTKFIKNVLHLRSKTIHKFSISGPLLYTHTEWMSATILLGIQEIHLQEIHLHNIFIKDVQLLNLYVNALTLDHVLLSSLVHLFNLPVTEYLVIKDLCAYPRSQSLVITAPQLKTLTLVLDNCHDSFAIDIRSPNLTCLKMKGRLYSDYYVENSASITNVELCMIRSICRYQPLFIKRLKKVLDVFSNAENITLSADFSELAEVFPESLCELKLLLKMFPSVNLIEQKKKKAFNTKKMS